MSFVFNNAKGKVRYYAELPAANDALILVPLLAAGLEAESTMKDYDDLAALLAGSTDEQTVAGRKTLAGVSITVDDTADVVLVDATDPVYTGVSTGGTVGAWLICYDPDTTTGTDSSLVPLTKHDLTWAPDGNSFTVNFGTGFYQAS